MAEPLHVGVVGLLFSVFFILLVGISEQQGWEGEMHQAWSEFNCDQKATFIHNESGADHKYANSYKDECHPSLEQEVKLGLITP